jgi:hypothetical protein
MMAAHHHAFSSISLIRRLFVVHISIVVIKNKRRECNNNMFITAFLQAVKKGPFARGGLYWKGHGAYGVTQTRKTNAKKRLRYVNENDSVLKEAVAIEKAYLSFMSSQSTQSSHNESK